MIFFTSTTFTFCVSALCITSVVGSYNHGHPLLINAKTHFQGRPEPHKIFKRQANFRQCDMVLLKELCTNGAYQDYASVFQRCNDSTTAYLFQTICTPNSMGEVCADDIFLQKGIKRVCSDSNSTCSSDCKDLLNSTRSELGCCIASIYNDSTTPLLYSPTAYAYPLWSSCEVEPVEAECPPSLITLPPAQDDTICSSYSHIEKTQLASATLCTPHFINPILQLSSKLNCYSIVTELSCRVNQLGLYCGALYEISYDFFVAANESCNDTTTCDPLCTEILNSMANTVGCCFNQDYNNTRALSPLTFEWLSYEFWSMCDLRPPGLCELRLVDINGTVQPVTTIFSVPTDGTQTGIVVVQVSRT